MISVIVSSRVQGNVNHNLMELVRSLAEHSRRPEDIELLVKFDVDDNLARETHTALLNKKLPFMVKCCYGERGRGYIDIHHGYNQLLPMVYEKTKIVIAMADDFRAEQNWDAALRNVSDGAGDYFIIHQRPHPVPLQEFVRIKDKPGDWKDFNMEPDPFQTGGDLYVIDEAPAWSRKLLEAACDLFPVSFTDAWTLCLEHALWHKYDLNLSRFMREPFISRITCEVDQPGNERWHTDRRKNFEYIQSPEFKLLVESQAGRIACHVKETVQA